MYGYPYWRTSPSTRIEDSPRRPAIAQTSASSSYQKSPGYAYERFRRGGTPDSSARKRHPLYSSKEYRRRPYMSELPAYSTRYLDASLPSCAELVAAAETSIDHCIPPKPHANASTAFDVSSGLFAGGKEASHLSRNGSSFSTRTEKHQSQLEIPDLRSVPSRSSSISASSESTWQPPTPGLPFQSSGSSPGVEFGAVQQLGKDERASWYSRPRPLHPSFHIDESSRTGYSPISDRREPYAAVYTQPLPPLSSLISPWHHHHYISSLSAMDQQAQDRYVCNICSKAFSRPSSLRIHSHSHTGEKPYQCPVKGCAKRFSVRSNMKRHERGCHGGYDDWAAGLCS